MRHTLRPAEQLDPPLHAEPIIGWRVWSLTRDAATGGLVLGSIARPERWPTMRPLRATCRAGGEHRSPDPRCSCGIYAASTAALLRNLAQGVRMRTECFAVGTVAMWGRVIEHRSGYRAEFAYPDRVRLACTFCLRDRSLREADVVLEEHLSGYELHLAACRGHCRGFRRYEASPAKQVQVGLLSTYAVDLLADPEPAARIRPGGVLVADHHPLVRLGMVRYLTQQGFRVVGAAEDGLEAVELAEALRPDVVTTCIRMPVVDGLEAARQIRKRLPETQIVFVTAYDDEHFKREAMASGAVGYVVKTSPCEDVVPAVRSALAVARSVRGKYWG